MSAQSDTASSQSKSTWRLLLHLWPSRPSASGTHNYWATMEVPSSDEELIHHQHPSESFDRIHEAKTDDLHAFILDDSAKMVLGMGIRSVQIQSAAANQN